MSRPQHAGYERCLFVGGPDHLTERDVQVNTMMYEVMERPPHLPMHRYNDGRENLMITCKVHTYRKVGKAAGLVIMEYQP